MKRICKCVNNECEINFKNDIIPFWPYYDNLPSMCPFGYNGIVKWTEEQ